VIIIGILAAIAIPTFLAQRDRANRSAIESDLRNAGAAATSCATANGGSYASCDLATIRTFGFNPTEGVTVTPTPATASWSATAVHENLEGTSGSFSTTGDAAGRVVITEPDGEEVVE
jgi:type IV pilus assembly protein PilA